MNMPLYDTLLHASGIMLRLLRFSDGYKTVELLGLLAYACRDLAKDEPEVLRTAITSLYTSLRDRNGAVTVSDHRELAEVILSANKGLGATVRDIAVEPAKWPPAKVELDFAPMVVFPSITSETAFYFAYKTLNKYFTGHGKLLYSHADIDMGRFPDVEKLLEPTTLSSVYYLWHENMVLLKEKNSLFPGPVFSAAATGDYATVFLALKDRGYAGQIRWYDHICPQPVIRDDFNPIYLEDKTGCPLTIYYNLHKPEQDYPMVPLAVRINKPLCCASKSQIRSAYWACWESDAGFDSLISYMEGAGIVTPE